MRVPLSWLSEYVDLPVDSTAHSVMDDLVRVGFEEEAVHDFDCQGPIVVGQVLEFQSEKQSNGKTIRWCQVRVSPEGETAADGKAEVRGIVCGADNFEVGDKVVVALPGAVLPKNFVISARDTYGHKSDGMIASGKELNLSDDHSGILRLQSLGLDPKVGSDALEILGLNDSAAEINVLPDRGYCLSIRGVAREYSHATKSDFRDPIGNAHPVSGEGFGLIVRDDNPIRGRKVCQSFLLRVVRGVDATRPTPVWMQARLRLAGMRSISLIVDITNYVMLETGQPIHGYDLDKVSGGLLIRRANPGEKLKTLDGQIRKLDAEDLLITDESGPIGLAGVMGGESTEVSDSTVNVLIEAAHFDPITVSRSARRHKLFSEASKRYERGVDPKVGDFAAARVIQLLEVHAGAKADLLGASYQDFDEAAMIFLPNGFAAELTGVHYQQDQIESVLRDIGCELNLVEDGLNVYPPSWRSDLRHKTDLVEEIARIVGYDLIPARLPVAPPGRGLTKAQQLRRSALNALAAAGMTEVLCYPFVSAEQNAQFSDNKKAIRLANPIQEEAAELRLSLIPGLIDTARRNLSRGLTDLALVESGSVFDSLGKKQPVFPSTDQRPTDRQLDELLNSIPNQPRMLGALMLGNRVPSQPGQRSIGYSVADALAMVRLVAATVGLSVEFTQATSAGFHPGRTASILVADESIGLVGELDPALCRANDLPRQVAIFEINFDRLVALAKEIVFAKPLGTLPAATQDLTLLVDNAIPAQDVLNAVSQGAGELLESISLTDDYRGANVAEGKKSLTFSLRFRAFDRTLTQAEASAARDAGVALAKKKYQAEIRL